MDLDLRKPPPSRLCRPGRRPIGDADRAFFSRRQWYKPAAARIRPALSKRSAEAVALIECQRRAGPVAQQAFQVPSLGVELGTDKLRLLDQRHLPAADIDLAPVEGGGLVGTEPRRHGRNMLGQTNYPATT